MGKMQIDKNIENGELTLTKEINAPLEKVWEAYTNAEIFEKWWGPIGWNTTVKECSVEPGGTLLYGMKCEDESQGEWYGQESWGKMVFESVDEPNGFVYIDYFCNSDGEVAEGMPATKTTMKFEETGTGTRITSIGKYNSGEDLKKVLDMGMEAGIEQTLDRLEHLVQN